MVDEKSASKKESLEWLLAPNSLRFIVSGKRTAREQALFNLYQKQQACFWTTHAVDLAPDRKEWETLSQNEQHFVKHILAFFAGSDGIVNENLALRFYDEVQVPEARLFYGFQIAMEGIHSEMYTAMLMNFVTDDAEYDHLFRAIETVPCIQKKAEWARRWTSSETASFSERLVAFACVEGIMFSGSFCAIYWLKKRNLLVNGLGQSNEYISRDEALHCEFACHLYSLLEHTRLQQERVLEIVKDAVDHEVEFVCDALPVALIGMNSALMTQYIHCVADQLLVALGYEKHYQEENPFSWMELISLQGKTNFFEKRVSEYQHMTGSSEGSAGERTFSLDEDF